MLKTFTWVGFIHNNFGLYQIFFEATKTGIQDIDYEQEGVLYACSECDYKASYNENLLKHFKAKHEAVKL